MPKAMQKQSELDEDEISAALDVRSDRVRDDLLWELSARVCDDHRRRTGFCPMCAQEWPCDAYMLGVDGLSGSMRPVWRRLSVGAEVRWLRRLLWWGR
ncbi:hypothetical protein GCM10009765_60000 [Fodinicola feengrottensis]|uniref:Uncharacterized protein n=1 Tax=Fodinicola feengrottensis TaxID=435914 RepID=A0ABN2ICS3_9ACTN